MTANFRTIEAEVARPAQWGGVYYGPKAIVLARTVEALLLWIPGHAAWSGTGQPWRYEPGSLMIHFLGNRRDQYARLSSGGRLVVRLKEKAADIDKVFGDGFSKLVEPSKTVVFG